MDSKGHGNAGPRPSGLDLAHKLLGQEEGSSWSLGTLLAEIYQTFSASATGLADLGVGQPLLRHTNSPSDPFEPPWSHKPEILGQARDAWSALCLSHGSRSWLLAAVRPSPGDVGMLLWLEAEAEREWSASDRGALCILAQLLSRSHGLPTAPRWSRQAERLRRQQRLEIVAPFIQRLAHDYGNILTTILGFTELSLGLPKSGRMLAGYHHELYHAARLGTDYTERLRLFCRRGRPEGQSVYLGPLLKDAVAALRAAKDAQFQIVKEIPNDLPPVFLTEALARHVLAELIGNARESLAGEGIISIKARVTTLTEEDRFDLYGSVLPGPVVEVRIADNGCGLTEEAWRSVLAVPFFTTKVRHRGLGLATVYGILRTHQGGFRLEPRPEGGTVAVLVLTAVQQTGSSEKVSQFEEVTRGAEPGPEREKVLVVDDDPQVLKFVSTALEQGGFRVQAALGGAEALRYYTAPQGEPFSLVLTDVMMPLMSGVDLARHLVEHDARLNLMFMTAQINIDFHPEIWGGRDFPVIRKPFLSEGLIQAVRTALAPAREIQGERHEVR